MPVYEGSREITLPATPADAFAVLTDYERLPEWQGPLTACEVLDRYDDGLGRDVRYEVDAKLRRVAYTLRHTYDVPVEIGSEYLSGDFECFEGRWTLRPLSRERTGARLEMRIDPGLRIPGRIQKMLNERILRSAVDDLRRRLEEA